MHILITGVAGFIGSHLAKFLLKKGCKVTGCDNLKNGNLDRLSNILDDSDFRFFETDVCQFSDMESLTKNVDWICHLAGEVGVSHTSNRPASSFKVNIRATEVILEIDKKTGAKVLLGSTSEVYGNPVNTSEALVETQAITLPPPVHPRWAYAASKAAAEYLASSYHHEFGVHTVICRFFNVTGAGQLPESGMVLPIFVSKAQKNKPLIIYGDGSQTRCFTYVEDAVEAIFRVMVHPENNGQIINIGSTKEISILKLAGEVIRQLNSSSEIMYKEPKWQMNSGTKDIKRRIPNIEKLHKMTGFKPATDLHTIIDSIAKFHNSTHKVGL